MRDLGTCKSEKSAHFFAMSRLANVQGRYGDAIWLQNVSGKGCAIFLERKRDRQRILVNLEKVHVCGSPYLSGCQVSRISELMYGVCSLCCSAKIYAENVFEGSVCVM